MTSAAKAPGQDSAPECEADTPPHIREVCAVGLVEHPTIGEQEVMVSFDTVPGTRGRRVTTIRGPVGRWLTRQIISQIRRRNGKMPILGFDVLVLTTIGARSGLERATPVGWFPGKDGSWLIVASAAGGRKNPAWYHNIAAHPGQVQVDTDGKKVAVIAEQLHGAERDQAWRQITTAGPRYAKDAEKTDRQLPVIRLVARADSSSR